MSFNIQYNQNKTKQIEQAVKVLASWIGEPDSSSNKTFKFLTLENNSEEIQKLNLDKTNELKKIDDFFIFSNAKNNKNEILIISACDRGLANGLYYMHMKLKEQQIRDPFSLNWNSYETPFFETRGITLFNLPLYLEGLCTDTWTFSEWKDYLNRLRSFNYNSIVFGLHAGLLYHPDFESMLKNSWRYNLYEKVFEYAADIGLEIILLYVLNELPTDLWIKYPEIRGNIEGIQASTYCSQKGKNFGENLLKYTLNRFKKVPSISLFAFEGGGCNCDYCRNNMADIIVDYLKFLKENAKQGNVYFCTWFAYVKENFYSPPIKGLRKKLFSKISKDVKIYDVSRKTLKMAMDQGFDIYDFLFLLDPEDGFENSLIFPKPLINRMKERISDSIRDLTPNLKGMFGYRLIPKARFINDYIFGRYLWDPEIDIDEVISETAGLLSQSIEEKEDIKKVIVLIEEFWSKLNGENIKECNKILKRMSKQQETHLEPLKSIQEALIVLDLLFQYYSTDSEKKRKSIIQRISRKMKNMGTFQCYTSYKVWDIVSLETIRQRVIWWTDPDRGLFDPKSFPWNCIAEGKYHLIEKKKDVIPWFEMKELLKIGVQRFISKLKKE